ncbi:magnesium transporter MgtE N-terminal domain-containing protein [Alkalicoccus luteus]|uniref:magnesium transporter MgtE N-terminal domain-containing protein n=1 Tax=Alkalicoccus luteus TaxID=1237094 RepID=UPI004034B6F7
MPAVKEKKQSKLQLIFMVVIIPVLFAVMLAGVVMYYLGFQPVRYAADFTASLFSEEEVDEEEEAVLHHENQELQRRIEELELELEEALAAAEEEDPEFEEEEDENEDSSQALEELEDMIRTLQLMTASRAAAIMEEMTLEEAVTYFRGMQVTSRAEILSRMEEDQAAAIINALSSE